MILLLIATNKLIDAIYETFLGTNIKKISRYIKKGEMDYIILKPLNTQFFISMRYIDFAQLLSVLIPTSIVLYLIIKGYISFNGFTLSIYLSLIICGIIIRYVFGFIIMLCSYWLTELGALYSLYNEFFDLASYPISIYKGFIKSIFIYVIPIIVIANFPVMFIYKLLNPSFIIYTFFLTIILLIISKLFFNFAIKNYTSASS